jgi:hypothetical protein
MGKSSFIEFIEQEKAFESRKKSIDWEERKDLYLKQLKTLFDDVENFLREFTESGAVQIKRSQETIEEESIGEYEIPVLHIQIYGKHADLVPVGTNLIGTPGGVDLIGDIAKIRFILADKDEGRPQIFAAFSWSIGGKKLAMEQAENWILRKRDYVWKIITDPPDIRYIELNEDSFLGALQEVLDG